MITSVSNAKIKTVRALQARSRERRESGSFVVEGVRLLEEALAAGFQAEFVIYTEGLDARAEQVVQSFAEQGTLLELATEAALAAASDTESPQGVLAVLKMRDLPLPGKLDFILIPDQVSDPGNLGTMLRTAAAAGVDAILLTPDAVDIYSPKVLRAGMGAQFRVPVRQVEWDGIQYMIESNGLRVFLAAAGSGNSCFEADFTAPLALIVGGEAQGASPKAHQLAHESVYIPMPGGSESLNAAVAAGVLLFEVVRQRSHLLE